MITDDKKLMVDCFNKYQNRFGYISFHNHLKAYIAMIEQLQFKETKDGFNQHDFEVNKKAMLEAFKVVQDMAELHKINNGEMVQVDLEGL